MNDPQRLLSGQADERERALLSAAQAEEPSVDALSRLQQTLGLRVDPSPLLGVRAAREGSLEATGGAAKGSSLLAGKWIVVALASATLVGALAWSRVATPDPVQRPARAAALETSGHAATPVVSPPAPMPTTGATASQALDPHADQAPLLRDELARLERARTALRDRRAGVASTTLDDYDRAHPHGALREEAEALRIETLLALDQVERARDLARAFLRSYPHSVHGARVASQLEQPGAR